jgi:prophage DNA circulation protein
MATLTIIKVEVTVITQEADPATTTAMGKEIKTETETAMHTDKMDADKTIKTKATATPNAHTIPATKSNAEKMRHTRLTQTMKAMMDKTLTIPIKAMTMTLTMNFTSPTKSFTTQT